MVAVLNSPHFNNDFPLNTDTPLAERTVRNEIANDTIGAAAGANTALVTKARVKAGNNAVTGHGRPAIETETVINRLTTAADVTALKAKVVKATSLVFPRDLSGNGGGAFSRT